MKPICVPGSDSTVEITTDELEMIKNALNEVCNGVEIEEPEFHTRLGATREDVRTLLQCVAGVLKTRVSR